MNVMGTDISWYDPDLVVRESKCMRAARNAFRSVRNMKEEAALPGEGK